MFLYLCCSVLFLFNSIISAHRAGSVHFLPVVSFSPPFLLFSLSPGRSLYYNAMNKTRTGDNLCNWSSLIKVWPWHESTGKTWFGNPPFLKSRCWSIWAEKRGLEHLSHFIIDKKKKNKLMPCWAQQLVVEVPSLAIRVRGTHQLTLPPKLDFHDPYPYDLVPCSRRSYSLLSCFSEGYFYALNIYACLKKERGLGGAAVSLVPALSMQRQVNLSRVRCQPDLHSKTLSQENNKRKQPASLFNPWTILAPWSIFRR